VIEPLWLSPEDVIYINKEVVEQVGQTSFLRDRGSLESAVAKPMSHFLHGGVDDLVSLATVFLFGIVRKHPFEDGNKRTGLLAADLFLQLNGYMIVGEASRALAASIICTLEGKLIEEQFTDMLRTAVQPI
jgi:death on curing protein